MGAMKRIIEERMFGGPARVRAALEVRPGNWGAALIVASSAPSATPDDRPRRLADLRFFAASYARQAASWAVMGWPGAEGQIARYRVEEARLRAIATALAAELGVQDFEQREDADDAARLDGPRASGEGAGGGLAREGGAIPRPDQGADRGGLDDGRRLAGRGEDRTRAWDDEGLRPEETDRLGRPGPAGCDGEEGVTFPALGNDVDGYPTCLGCSGAGCRGCAWSGYAALGAVALAKLKAELGATDRPLPPADLAPVPVWATTSLSQGAFW